MEEAKIVSVFDGTTYKLGSLFDGSGGFPLAGSVCGIKPCWAAEVEPYPIAVTRSRFPNMKHLGDISKVNGAEIEPVDIITFGSPCQDLSVAGKRAGLKHEANGDDETTRSGLFMEAVRIIKEMRAATGGQFPRWALWENVPGAFSSQKGEDFRVVLEELIRIVEPGAVMPPVPKAGWAYADHFRGDGWSLAYRVFDAQYWGVPQRRRRIHLILDLRGECAGEVLFEREGVRGYFAEGRTPQQAAPTHAQGGPGADDRAGIGLDIYNLAATGDIAASLTTATGQGASNTGPSVAIPYAPGSIIDSHILDDQGGQQISVRTDGKAPTLRAEMHGNVPAVMEPKAYPIENHPADSRVNIDESGKVQTLTSRMGTGGGNVPMVMEPKPVVYTASKASFFTRGECNLASTLVATDWKDPQIVAFGVDCRNATEYPEMAGALQADAAHNLNSNNTVRVQYIVRRLTPTECARLQGFADRHGDIDEKDSFTPEEFRFWHDVRNTHARINGKKVQEYTEAQMLTWYNKLHTDSAEYKMWGNGIALPPALYCMQGIVDAMNKEEDDTWLL